MGEIVKKLNLNRTPQQVEPNSMIFAKNIKLDSTCSAIVRDDKLVLDKISQFVREDNKLDDYEIAGVITASNEVCVFYADISVPDEKTIDIYRYNAKFDKINMVGTNIKWHGGQIEGTYNYNVRNELILIFCEHDSADGTDVPMRTINLGVFDETTTNLSTGGYAESYYNLLPDIPVVRMGYVKPVYGINIPNGTYKFFIRYEINEQENTYSDWIPVGRALFAANLSSEAIINFVLKYDNYHSKHEAIVNNLDKDCDYGFELNFEFCNIPAYISRYQIGYILNHDNTQLARVYNTYNITNTRVIFDGRYSETTEVSEFLERRINLYNIGNIISYDSRVYISNYKEKNDNIYIQDAVDNVKVRLKRVQNTYNETSTVIALNVNAEILIYPWTESSTGVEQYEDIKYPYYYELQISNVENINEKIPLRSYLANVPVEVFDKVYTKYTSSKKNNWQYSDEHDIENCYALIKGTSRNCTVRFLCDDVEYDTIYNGDSPYITSSGKWRNMYKTRIDSISLISENNTEAIVASQTLCPNEVYNFFVHFVRADGSYTNGIQLTNDCEIDDKYKQPLIDSRTEFPEIESTLIDKFPNTRVFEIINCKDIEEPENKFSYYENINGDKLFRVDDDESYLYYPEFYDINIPEGFIGYFFSYEKVEPLFNYTGVNNDGKIQAAELDLGLCSPTSSYFTIQTNSSYTTKYFDANNPEPISYFSSNIFNHTLGQASGAFINTNSDSMYKGDAAVVNFYSINNAIYTKKVKTLYRLTDVFVQQSDNTNIRDYDLPAYYVKDDAVFDYKFPIVFSEDGDVKHIVADKNQIAPFIDKEPSVTETFINNNNIYKYSRYNLTYKSLKTRPDVKVFVYEPEIDRTRINAYVEPANLANTFELKPDYILSDKSATTINDLVSVLAYDKLSSAKEQFDNTIRRSDVYADESIENTWRNFRPSEYKVISNIRGKITKIIPFSRDIIVHFEHGFFLIDRDNRLRTRNTYAQLESPDIFELVALEIFPSEKGYLGLQDKDSSILVNDAYICYDHDSKTIFSFGQKYNLLSTPIDKFLLQLPITTCKCAYDVVRNRVLFCFQVKDSEPITLSYNILSSSFVSLHDFKYTRAYNTKQNVYLQTPDNKKLSVFVPNTDEPRDYFLHKETALTDMYGDCKVTESKYYPIIYNEKTEMPASIIDIIFNGQYEISKVLNSITYLLTRERAISAQMFQAEDENDSDYPGEKLMFYSDRTHTEYIDVNDAANDNSLLSPDSYKKPWYDNGVWNYNYFKNAKSNTSVPEDKSYIYGKYFVVRFVFDGTKLFKLSNIGYSYNTY